MPLLYTTLTLKIKGAEMYFIIGIITGFLMVIIAYKALNGSTE